MSKTNQWPACEYCGEKHDPAYLCPEAIDAALTGELDRCPFCGQITENGYCESCGEEDEK